MTSPRLTYEYFRDPFHFSTWTDEPIECDGCLEEKAVFQGPFFGEEELEVLCEDCLARGLAGECGATTNDADMEALREQLAAANPAAPVERIATEVERKTVVITERTPPLASFHPMAWPAHCGDYCVYIKEAGRDDVPSNLESSLPADILTRMRAGSPADNYAPHTPAVYRFECRTCATPIFTWEEAPEGAELDQ